MSGGTLYYGQPINWAHPLNRGLSSLWKVVPWYSSGLRVIDLAGVPSKHHAAFNGTVTWNAGDTPIHSGGFGHVTFSSSGLTTGTGSDTFVFSLFAWVFQTNQLNYHTIFGNTAPRGWYLKNGVNNFYDAGDHLGTATIPTSTWTNIGCTCDGTNLNFYINGHLDNSQVFGAHVSDVSGGIGTDGTGNFLIGSVDDFRFYPSRCLSERDVFQLYLAVSQRQDPTLNWLHLQPKFAPTAAAAGGPFPWFSDYELTGPHWHGGMGC